MLVQIIACRLFDAKPLSKSMLGYCQLNTMNKLQWNFNQNTKIFIHKKAYENIACEMAAILSGGDEFSGCSVYTAPEFSHYCACLMMLSKSTGTLLTTKLHMISPKYFPHRRFKIALALPCDTIKDCRRHLRKSRSTSSVEIYSCKPLQFST